MSTIIYVHTGDSFYLLPNLLHTRAYNPNAKIILLGDKKNAYVEEWGFEHFLLDEYMNLAHQFEQVYVHYSPNSYQFELFCFQRWFAISEFVQKQHLEKFLVCDTDAFLYCNIDDEFDKYSNVDFTITRNGTPCFTYFSKDSIKRFVEYITWCYTSEVGKKRIEDYHQRLVDSNKDYGISDMSAFVAWEQLDGAMAIHVDVPNNGIAYDHNFIDVNDGYKMDGSHKLIAWENDIPYEFLASTGEKIMIKGIHLQGKSKYLIHKMIPYKYIKPVLGFYLKEIVKYRLRTFKHKILKS
jgi:hypothetical protein